MEIFTQILDRYQSLESYKDEGQAYITLTNTSRNHQMIHQVQFRTLMEKERLFEFHYTKTNDRGEEELIGSIVKYSKDDICSSMTRFAGQEAVIREWPLHISISAHTGISNGVAYTVPRLLFQIQVTGRLFYEGVESKVQKAELEGVPCLEVQTREQIQNTIPNLDEMEATMKEYNLPYLNKEVMEKMRSDIKKMEKKRELTRNRRYFFRESDLLLIRIEETGNGSGLKIESVTNYRPLANIPIA